MVGHGRLLATRRNASEKKQARRKPRKTIAKFTAGVETPYWAGENEKENRGGGMEETGGRGSSSEERQKFCKILGPIRFDPGYFGTNPEGHAYPPPALGQNSPR